MNSFDTTVFGVLRIMNDDRESLVLDGVTETVARRLNTVQPNVIESFERLQNLKKIDFKPDENGDLEIVIL